MKMNWLAWLALVAHAVAAIGAEEPPLALENAALRLEIGRMPAPYIRGLVHKVSGKAVVSEPRAKDLFAVVLAGPGGETKTIASSAARQSSARREKDRLTLDYDEFPGKELSARVTARCSADDPLVRWSIEVRTKGAGRLTAVRFPMLTAAPRTDDARGDFLVLPYMPGTLIERPWQQWREGQSQTLAYPGGLSAQFVAYQDRTAGVYLAGTDTLGLPMALGVAKRADGIACHHEFVLPANAGSNWTSPYTVAVGVTQGDWYHTADLYKRWAVRQPWCAKTLVDRDDIPAWWKSGPAVYTSEVRTYDAQRFHSGSFYPQMPDHLRMLRQKIDGPIVAMLGGWEQHRRWTAGDYFPVFDEARARPAIARMKQDGFWPFFFLSGLFYTYENEGRNACRIPGAEKYRDLYVIDEKTRQVKTYVLDESSGAGQWRRNSYQFCVAAPGVKEFYRQVIDRAHELGVDMLQMDQTTGGAGDVCYATSHGHVPGAGSYPSQEFYELLHDMRRYGKTKTKDFLLLHEEPHEQLIPYLDGIHTREYMEKRWYRATTGSVGIPLFSYLYHEYAIAYGGDSAVLNKYDSPWLVRQHAVNLVTGRTPGASVWSQHQSAVEAHPNQIAMLRNHCRLLATRAKDCLMVGRMLHPCELDVPRVTYKVYVEGRRGTPARQEPFEEPAVLTSSWQSPAGRIGHLLVNVTDTKQTLRLDVDTRNAPALGTADVDVYRSTVDSRFQTLWQDTRLPRPYATEMGPLEVVFLEIRAAGQP